MTERTANMAELRRGTERVEGYDDDGNPMIVQDHTGREGHGRIYPKPAPEVNQ